MSIQYDTQRLLREYENEQTFLVTTNNDELANLVSSEMIPELDANNRYIFSEEEYQQFQELADQLGLDQDEWEVTMSSDSSANTDYSKHQKNPNYYNDRPNDYFSKRGVEEMSTTSGAGAYLTKAKRKLSEDVNSGYKKVKGFRPGHSKITIVEPKDLWNVNEEIETSGEDKKGVEIQIGDQVKILTNPKGGRGEVIGFDEKKANVKVTAGGGSTYEREASYFPNEIEKIEDVKPKEKDKKQDSEEIPIKESYARFRNETKTRSKSQQFHEAAKIVDKKLKEINKILEYTSQLKSELFEDENCNECYSRTGKIMEKISKGMVQAYSKVKKLK